MVDSFDITRENMAKSPRCYIMKVQKDIPDAGSKLEMERYLKLGVLRKDVSEETALKLDLGVGFGSLETGEEGGKGLRVGKCTVRLNLFELEDLEEGK